MADESNNSNKEERQGRLKLDYTPHKRKWWHIPLLILLIAGTAYIIRTNNPDTTPKNTSTTQWNNQNTHKTEGKIFGTFYHITYQCNENLDDSIIKVLNLVDNSLSPFNESSIISSINSNKSFNTNKMFDDVFNIAQAVSKTTDGAFDITVAPLVNAWGFGFKNKEKISDNLIDSLKSLVG